VKCPTLIIHGDHDRRVFYEKGKAIHDLVPGSRLLTIGGGGHLTACRDPVVFNQAVRDFVAGTPRASTWVRAMSRRRKALFISSPIGLGHVQRDVAIARELRKLQPDLEIDWFTVDPAHATSSTKANGCIRSRGAWRTRAGTSSTSRASTTCTRSSRCGP